MRKADGIHPLSIEAISPTSYQSAGHHWRLRVSILCQSRLFLLPGEKLLAIDPVTSIHPLSIEAISPTNVERQSGRMGCLYPSSVNRGYFSYPR